MKLLVDADFTVYKSCAAAEEDFDLGDENLPAETHLSIGSAVLGITEEPHNGCKKFVERFGMDAMLFVNSEIGKKMHLRGVNARVIQAGNITVGDIVSKV